MSFNGTNTCGGDVCEMFFLARKTHSQGVCGKEIKKCSFVLEESLDDKAGDSMSVIPSLK